MLKCDHFKMLPVSVHSNSEDTGSIAQAAGSHSWL